MKILVISVLLASTSLLAGCVEESGYRGDAGYRPGGPYVSERWRDNRDDERDRYRDRARYDQVNRDRDRGDWRRDGYNRQDRDRGNWRNRDNRTVPVDQYGRPIIYYNR